MRSKGFLHVDTEIVVPFFDVDMMNIEIGRAHV